MGQSHSSNNAFTQKNAVVFHSFVHGSRKRNIGGKIGHDALQGP
jgi:hypothetical protein